MTSFTTSIKHLAFLNRTSGTTWINATKRKAPYKPAVLDLVHRGVITSPFIAETGDLVELNELFNLYWRRIIPLGQTSSIAFPFSRLDREPDHLAARLEIRSREFEGRKP
jgi:putative restriction endonuclease